MDRPLRGSGFVAVLFGRRRREGVGICGQWRIPHTANRPGLCPLRLTGQVSLAGVSAAISAHSSQTTR
jgi:hypothetical protein